MQGVTRHATDAMDIGYRHAQPDDVSAISKVLADAINALSLRHGFGDEQINPVPPNPYFAFALREEPEGFWVAEGAGEVVGFTHSWMRGPFWFLAHLFISPGCQGKGVGRRLLDKALEYGSPAAIANRSLITFAYNPTSISLYMRSGMYPREPLYAMRGASSSLRARRTHTEAPTHERVGAGQDTLEALSRVDEQVLGFARELHHRYFLSAPGASCYLFRNKSAVDGYAYVWTNGRVGPLAVTSPSRFAPVMNAALGLAAAENTDSVSIIVPGSNEQGVAIALSEGMRISYPLLLMSAKPFGNWGSYLFLSPALL